MNSFLRLTALDLIGLFCSPSSYAPFFLFLVIVTLGTAGTVRMRWGAGGIGDVVGNVAHVSGKDCHFLNYPLREPGATTTQLLRISRRKFNTENE